jgi:mannan endo-1,4-beta-mannosidase
LILTELNPYLQTFVNHSDGFTLQYNNPANPAYTTSRIKLIRQHLMQMSQNASISADAALQTVACPADAGAGGSAVPRRLSA